MDQAQVCFKVSIGTTDKLDVLLHLTILGHKNQIVSEEYTPEVSISSAGLLAGEQQ